MNSTCARPGCVNPVGNVVGRGRPRKFCDEHRRLDVRRRYVRVEPAVSACVVCGVEIVGASSKMYCSSKCKWSVQKTRVLPREGVPCRVCGKPTSVRWAQTSTPESVKHKKCFEHGTEYGYNKHGCRCDACRDAAVAVARAFRERRAAAGRPVVYRRATVERACLGCGESFDARVDNIRSGKGIYCSRRCRTLFETGVDVEAPDYVKSDRFRVSDELRLAVYERDGFACWLCGGPVDMSADPCSDMFASLDHVVPRSRGGSDDPSNLRCAHRLCNSLRGAPEVTCEVAVGNSQMALW